MNTLFGSPGQAGHKPKKERAASYPPAPWLVRRLLAAGVPQSELDGRDARYCYARLSRLEDERAAEGRQTTADDPATQGADGWSDPERRSMGADLLVAVESGDTLTRERVLSLVEGSVQCLTRAELYRVARGLGRMLTDGGAGRATSQGDA